MNIAVIVNNNVSSEKMKVSIETAFKDDNVKVITYRNTDDFLAQMGLRRLQVDRILLLEQGIDGVTDEGLFEFVGYINKFHPATRILTVSREMDMAEYFYHMISVEYVVHIATKQLTMQTIVDFATDTIDNIKKRYDENVYKPKSIAQSVTLELGEEQQEGEGQGGFLSKLFGKKKPKKGRDDGRAGLDAIGTSRVGYDPLLENPEEEDFGEVEELVEGDVDFSVFQGELDESDFEEEESIEEYEPTDFSDYEGLPEEVGFEEEPDSGVEEDIEEDIETELDFSDFSDGSIFGGGVDLEKKEEEDTIEEPEEEPIEEPVEEPIEEPVEEPVEEFDGYIEERDDSMDIDLAGMMDEYQEGSKEVIEVEKVVERVVEVEKIVEKIVEINTGSTGKGARNRNGIRVIVVTGDRGSEVTKTALNLATLSALEEKTLYVDFDRYRKGSLSYLGINELIQEEEHVQNGVKHLKTTQMLPNLVGTYTKGKFYTLTSMYGEAVSEDELNEAQRVLTTQQEFKTVVIDCPLENLYLMTDIIATNNILVCIRDNRTSVINTVIELMASTGDAQMLSAIYEKMRYFVTGKGTVEGLREHLEYVNNLFGLDETLQDWSKIDIIGCKKDIKLLLGRL